MEINLIVYNDVPLKRGLIYLDITHGTAFVLLFIFSARRIV